MGDESRLMIEMIRQQSARFDVIEAKLDRLFAFKWQIIGGSAAASLFLTGLFHSALFLLK